ncbi:hypothetical protein B9Z55_008928 [Caenorhabditis nigoni]|nr:hypothetical protein B9Z55_008928 [Caenorhabditis nigoni]
MEFRLDADRDIWWRVESNLLDIDVANQPIPSPSPSDEKLPILEKENTVQEEHSEKKKKKKIPEIHLCRTILKTPIRLKRKDPDQRFSIQISMLCWKPNLQNSSNQRKRRSLRNRKSTKRRKNTKQAQRNHRRPPHQSQPPLPPHKTIQSSMSR